MNVLFISLADFSSLDGHDLYSDLLREFVKNGHHIDIIAPIQKRKLTNEDDVKTKEYSIFKPHIGNVTNTPFIEKGISLLTIQNTFIKCIKDKIGKKKIDLLIIATPPLLDRVVKYVKRIYSAKTYLLLKDIWPGSILDLPVPGGEPVKKLIYAYYRHFEKRLYKFSDYIGCMSQANVYYIVHDNPWLDKEKVHINYNSIEPQNHPELSANVRMETRKKYGVPIDKICFVYGGTLGVGQNVAHIVECLKVCEDLNCHFVISGTGVQYNLLKEYREKYNPKHLTLINGLPKDEYDKLMQSCDVGLVFLRYTDKTPNIPSRILTYMDYGLPIVSCTDPVSDLNQIIEKGEFGWGCLSDDPVEFRNIVQCVANTDIRGKSINSKQYLEKHFTARNSYEVIISAILGVKRT